MSATRPRGWRTGGRRRRPAPKREQQALPPFKLYEDKLRRQLTENCEVVLRAVFGSAHALARDLRGTPGQDAASALRVGVLTLIEEHSRRLGVPTDSLGVRVELSPHPQGPGYSIGLQFLMPTDSDIAQLEAVVRELAAKERGR